MRDLMKAMKCLFLATTLAFTLGFSTLVYADEAADTTASDGVEATVGEQTTPSADGVTETAGSDANADEQSVPDEGSAPGTATLAPSTDTPSTDTPAAPSSTAPNEANPANPDEQSVPDEQTPLSVRAYESGWSLVNLVASLLTIIIGVGLVGLSMMRQHKSGEQVSSNFGLTIFGMAAAVISTILFTSTGDIQAQPTAVDGYTVVHLTILAVSILCAFLSVRKDLQKDTQDTTAR
jgi:hypothetical protein